MSGKSDEIKGKVKQQVGKLTGDDDLRDEGIADELGGKIKKGAEKVKDAVGDVVDKLKGDK